nr:MAG TPA: hypothetical protein [Bacteriophage sp.]
MLIVHLQCSCTIYAKKNSDSRVSGHSAIT